LITMNLTWFSSNCSRLATFPVPNKWSIPSNSTSCRPSARGAHCILHWWTGPWAIYEQRSRGTYYAHRVLPPQSEECNWAWGASSMPSVSRFPQVFSVG
jgi:hypothetical protein